MTHAVMSGHVMQEIAGGCCTRPCCPVPALRRFHFLPLQTVGGGLFSGDCKRRIANTQQITQNHTEPLHANSGFHAILQLQLWLCGMDAHASMYGDVCRGAWSWQADLTQYVLVHS